MIKMAQMILLAILTAGCAAAPAPDVTPANPPAQTPVQPPPAANPAPAPKPDAGGVPLQDEVCRKPSGGPDISFRMARAQSDGGYRAQAGWTVPWQNSQVLGWVDFPRAVDPQSVRMTAESPDWVLVSPAWPARDEQSVPFVLMPRDGAEADPLQFRTGKNGWVTVKVESAKGKDGKELLAVPATLRLFMFDQAMATKHDYLPKCLASIGVKAEQG